MSKKVTPKKTRSYEEIMAAMKSENLSLVQAREGFRAALKKFPENEALRECGKVLNRLPKSEWMALRATPEGQQMASRMWVHIRWLVGEVDRLVRTGTCKDTVDACNTLVSEWCGRTGDHSDLMSIHLMDTYYEVKKRDRALARGALAAAAKQKKPVLLRELHLGSGMKFVTEALEGGQFTFFCVQGLTQLTPKKQAKMWKAVMNSPVFSVVIVRKEDDLGVPALTNKMVHVEEV